MPLAVGAMGPNDHPALSDPVHEPRPSAGRSYDQEGPVEFGLQSQ